MGITCKFKYKTSVEYLTLEYFLLVCLFVFVLCFWLLLPVFFFSNKRIKRNGVDLGGWGCGEDLGKFEAGEVVIRIYCMKRIYF